jgi:4'-phosphopantetheinyl transferase EntD
MKVAFRLELPHGLCAGVEIPAEMPEASMAALRPEERAAAEQLSPTRRLTWVAGRLALRAALDDLGIDTAPLLASDRGAPLLPAGALGSISHKRTLAVALAARRAGDGVELGVDLEEDAPLRIDISRRVLSPEESRALEGATVAERDRGVLLRLCAKEAIYKALDPFVRRYVSFQEVTLTPLPDGTSEVALALSGGEGPFGVEVHWRELKQGASFFLATASVSHR